jgi:uncharacterized protein (DUF302 family)
MDLSSVILESESRFGFEETIARITRKAELNGWRIPTVHDLQETLKKSDIHVGEVRVVELCKPQFSGTLMKEDSTRFVSSLMPCRISIYTKTNGKTYVSRINTAMVSMFMPGTIGQVMGQAGGETEEIISDILTGKEIPDY